MAKKAYDGSINYLRRDIDWGVGDASATEGLPLSGATVQQYIKDNFDHKAGWFYTDQSQGKCFVFASQEDCSTYLEDTSTYAYLVLGEFAAINEFVASIDVTDPSGRTKTLFTSDESAQKIKFNWDIKNKDSQASQDEDVKCTYTITRQGYTNTYTVFYSSTQKSVETDITEYLKSDGAYVEGETYINIYIEGQTHPVTTTVTITYKIVNFSFTNTSYDVSKKYKSTEYVSFLWSATGLGAKKTYLFIDGSLSKTESIGSSDISKTETIPCAGLSDGRHNIIMYASITFDGGTTYYFSDVICRDFIVYSDSTQIPIIAAKLNVPSSYLTIKDTDTSRGDCYPIKIYDAEQYVQYSLTFGAYNYSGTTTVNVKLGDDIIQDNVTVENEKETTIYFSSEDSGTITLSIIPTNGPAYNISTIIAASTLDIQETHAESVEFNFDATGMSNDSSTKAKWTYSNPLIMGGPTYTATFNGFNWNSTSGWVNNGLYINADSSISFDYNPFGSMPYGKTFEIELETKNVSDDDTIICDISLGNTTRFMLKANAGTLISDNGVELTNKFKSEERTRLSFVINPADSTNEKLAFVYVNGILSGGVYFGSGGYVIAKNLVISGSSSAQVWIKQIRVYNIALTSDEILNNYIRYRDTGTEMKSLYDKNNIISSGSFSKDLMLKNLKLPVMTVIGVKDGIPAVKWLDTLAGKTDGVDVNILFENPWDPETGFYAEHITMTPQGTSSMVYPKRNYRMYTAYSKLVDPTEFKMWYTHGYGIDQKDKWTEIEPNSKGNRKYRFKDGTQKVVRWTIKADFAESSGTHNTGTARLWNDVMRSANVSYDQSPTYYKKVNNTSYEITTYNAIISTPGVTDASIETVTSIPSPVLETSPFYIKILGSKSISGQRALETKAQEHARIDKYIEKDGSLYTFEEDEGEVRTTVDGYPIAMFYQKTEDDQLVFMGKYNFNNDKSSESVFGFCDISTFDNAYNGYYKPGTGHGFFDACDSSSEDAEQYKNSMQCWELTNSGDNIALYITTPAGGTSTDFRSGFEIRYPGVDGEDEEITYFTTYVKPFADWMVGIRNDACILREDPSSGETSRTYAEYTVRDAEYYETYVKDRTELQDISFWINDASLALAGYTLVSEKLTDEEIEAFPNIQKKIQYKKEGSDVINVQFVKKNESLYEQSIKTISNKIVSWTNPTRFKDEKWQHFDVFKIAAYYIYLIRFGAVDQTVKNAMFTSEDGRHWYYINYDNDTILGVRNDGRLKYDPDITRQTWDEGISDYAYAGYESTLWNALENDDEFMNEIVPAVDDALYKAGLTYTGATTEFNTNQCKKWCEKIYNQDAQYKYVDSYVQDKKNYLDSMQGSRETHRNWWISRRFNYYDAKFANTNYTGNYIYFLAPQVTEYKKFKIVSGNNTYYSIGVNNRMISEQDGTTLPINLPLDSSFAFRCPNWTLQVGSPVNIYSATNIKELDFSYDDNAYGSHISQIKFSGAYSSENGTKLEKLILNGNSTNTSYSGGSAIVDIQALKKLKYLDVKNIKGTSDAPVTQISGIDELENLETFIATGSNLQNIEFFKGAPLKTAFLSSETTTLTLNELSNLSWYSGNTGLKIGNGSISDMSKLRTLKISKCPKLSNNFNIIYNWYNLYNSNDLTLSMDNISWTYVNPANLIELGKLTNKTLSGKIVTSSALTLDQINQLKTLYSDCGDCFNPSNSLYITDNTSVYVLGPTSITEGNSATYSCVILAGDPTTATWSLDKEGEEYPFDISASTGVLTTRETYEFEDTSVNVILTYTNNKKQVVTYKHSINILKAVYPILSDFYISGPTSVNATDASYTIESSTSYTGSLKYSWSSDIGCITIEDNSKKTINVTVDQELLPTIETGYITVNICESYDETIEIGDVSLQVTFINNQVLITNGTNEYLLKAINDLGWIDESEHPNTYYLKSEAHDVSDGSMADLCNKIKSSYSSNITSLKEFGEFTAVEHLPSSAFAGNYENIPALKEIVLPPSLLEIPNMCFSYNINLESVSIPQYVTYIGDYAFNYCSNLKTITFESQEYLKNIYSYAFRNCRIESLDFPKTLESIGNYAFYMSSLKNLVLPESTSTLGTEITQYCDNVETIKVDENNSTYSSKDSAGYECNAILSHDGKTVILGCKNTVIPSDAVSIGSRAFRATNYSGDASNHLELPDTITSIGEYAFTGCGIKSVKFSTNDNFTSINTYSFSSCPLESVDIPDNVTEIKSSAFYLCSGLKDISIGKGLTTINSAAFGQCNHIESIYVNSENSVFKDSGTGYSNVLYDCQNRKLYAVASGFSFPSDLKTLDTYLFNSRNSSDVSILDFRNTALETIENYAVQHVDVLKELYFPNTSLTLGYSVFYGCSNLHFIWIPSSNIPSINTNSWGTSSNTAGYSSGTTNELYVNSSAKSAYQSSSLWTDNLLNSSYGKFELKDITTE